MNNELVYRFQSAEEAIEYLSRHILGVDNGSILELVIDTVYIDQSK